MQPQLATNAASTESEIHQTITIAPFHPLVYRFHLGFSVMVAIQDIWQDECSSIVPPFSCCALYWSLHLL
jgi:hypothetical protein